MATHNVVAIIDLNPPRVYVEIDGKDWPFVDVTELSLQQLTRIQVWQSGIRASVDTDDESDEEAAKFSATLDKIVHVLLPSLSEGLHKRLRDFHRLNIISAFTVAVSPKVPMTEPPTSLEPSVNSSDSMVEASGTG